MNKRKFFYIAAYVFLALAGLSAWDQYPSGWRHYLGLAFFFLSSLRILMILFSKKRKDGE
jgi:hypothetical protein